jgi:hypothetical protein
MDPVDPKMLRRFLKLLPSRLFSSVFLSDASELTGADGSIHPSPVPWDPDFAMDATTDAAVDDLLAVAGACLLRFTKADAVPAQRADVAAKVSATLLIVVVAVQGGPWWELSHSRLVVLLGFPSWAAPPENKRRNER